jgi:uncharacterized protein YecE (DUF72 family)
MAGALYIGCAGWNLRREHHPLFPAAGSHLERYAARFNCVEINSSFYRSHRTATYQRWASSTPANFRFSVKLPRQITHLNRLRDSAEAILQFRAEVQGLGPKLGAILVQLPPSLAFEPKVFDKFVKLLGDDLGPIVVEPRHITWFTDEVGSMLEERKVGRAAADPAVASAASQPRIASDIAYYRWHGTPRMYYSHYDESSIALLARQITATSASAEAWCIFDNTAEGAATSDALSLQEQCRRLGSSANRGL